MSKEDDRAALRKKTQEMLKKIFPPIYRRMTNNFS